MTAPSPQCQPIQAELRRDDPNAELVEILAEMGRDGDGACEVAAKVIVGLTVSHATLKARIQELEGALREMLNTFQPFTMKPVGAPNSPARLGQEHQIDVQKRARAALSPKPAEETKS